ncbi:hypothetical protein QLX67_10825 [Balneolaceae bacterium ANBcel3]|nr:hypothetical protein [Balneolaceae bacterium ANBcel3]
MNKEQLIESAKKLGPFSKEAYVAYEEKSWAMIQFVNDRMLRRPDLSDMVSESNVEMMKDNHANHALFIASMLKNYDPGVLVETVLWVFRAYKNRGFQSTYWPSQLQAWMSALREHVAQEQARHILPLYHWILVHTPVFDRISSSDTDNI